MSGFGTIAGNVSTRSGDYVSISGTVITSMSGNIIQISGQYVSIVNVSGIVINTNLPATTAATIHNVTLPAVGNSLIGGAITPSNPPSGFRTEVGITSAGQLTAVIDRGANAQSMLLNVGNNLNSGCLYIFDVTVHSGDTMDLTYSDSSGIIQVIRIEEVSAMVI